MCFRFRDRLFRAKGSESLLRRAEMLDRSRRPLVFVLLLQIDEVISEIAPVNVDEKNVRCPNE